MRRSNRRTKKTRIKIIWLIAVAIILMTAAYWQSHRSNDTSLPTGSKQNSSVTPSFNKSQYPTDQASSLWAVVNKGRALLSNYVPADLTVPRIPLRTQGSDPEMHLRIEAAQAMETMFSAADKEAVHLRLASGYRSYSEQVSIYGSEVKANGQVAADRESARPGHSEHQTGLAADLEPFERTCEVESCFANTPSGKWLAANAYKYGFVIRYQQGNENLTGYKYEPWHIRYIGKDLAAQIHKTNQTLEQFFGLPNYTDYTSNQVQLR
jgi:zinc D-Ala-D-Ala carboxypeptidase